jgi:glyoxylase-like metal-dependent hydrolase (beta-lactamase superfamily II)
MRTCKDLLGHPVYAILLALCLIASPVRAQGTYQAGDKVDTIPVGMMSIKTTKITDNFYVLTGIAPATKGYNVPNGRYGGQIGILTGPDGIFMVDGQYPPTDITNKVLAAIHQFSNAPIKFMVNTHAHVDHVGGNEAWAKMGVTIISQVALRNELAHQKGYPEGGVPKMTYDGPITFHMNGEDIRVIPMPPAHTDGDTIVYFPREDLIMTGDFYRASYPNLREGGSINGMIEALGKLISIGGPKTQYVPGHGPITNRDDVIAYRDMVVVLRDRVQAQLQQGKTKEEIAASHVAADYDQNVLKNVAGRFGEVGGFYDDGTIMGYANFENRFLGQLYDELKCLNDGGAAPTCRGK